MPTPPPPVLSSVAPLLEVAPLQPSDDVIKEAVRVLESGGVIAFPTDTLYGIGCAFGRPHAIDRIAKLRSFDGAKRPLTFLLPDLGALPHWAVVGGASYRILSRIFPGPYCVELVATGKVPNPYVHEERRTIGVRVPDNVFCEKVLWALGTPMLTATAKSRTGVVLTTAQDIQAEYGAEIDLVIDAGQLAGPPSTVVSLVDDWVAVLREGRGPSGKVLLG